MTEYIILTEAALDTTLVRSSFSGATGIPEAVNGVCLIEVADGVSGFRMQNEYAPVFTCVVRKRCIEELLGAGGSAVEIFQRIARVLKGLRSPPVHLPRHWSEYHHQNLLALFALPRDVANLRWVVELSRTEKCAIFDQLTSDSDEVDLAGLPVADLSSKFSVDIKKLLEVSILADKGEVNSSLTREIDLYAIGGGAVVAGRTYEEWEKYLTEPQRAVLNGVIDASIRIVGPAGSGKTLSLCMRALKISRDSGVISKGGRILVATHSWAMSQRIDEILATLNAGMRPENVTVFPLLGLLEFHLGYIGQRRTEVIGDDSTDGRLKSLEIIGSVISKLDRHRFADISEFLKKGLRSDVEGRDRIDLIVNLYEEISGVLVASGVSPDDKNAVNQYILAKREDWMPPFPTKDDRVFVVEVYGQFARLLMDRESITTDQFVLDAIRMLESFAWRLKRETEGYDYILVDELQLFDPQERSALELLGRSRWGVPFATAEDPSQGVFGVLNTRREVVDNVPVYLDTVHRFNRGIFNFVNFLYQSFPLNALVLRVSDSKIEEGTRPRFIFRETKSQVIEAASEMVNNLAAQTFGDQRICIVTLGDVSGEFIENLKVRGLSITKIDSFDDVEKLSYQRRSIVISPWQFIGGTQFAHVVVLIVEYDFPTSQFGRLREKTAVYLSCSRATDTLTILCSGYVPNILREAKDNKLIDE